MANVRFLLGLGLSFIVIAGLLWHTGAATGQGSPQPGTWQGTVEFEADSGPATAPISFEIDAAGEIVDGAVTLRFAYPTMSADLLDLMQQYGCVVPFDTIAADSAPVAGNFADPGMAEGTFTAERCTLQKYGDLEFMAAIEGTWTATLTTPASAEAAPVTPTLTPENARPTRVPTLDPNQPTTAPTIVTEEAGDSAANDNVSATGDDQRPTRVPTLDPNQPTVAPTRVPTLDPNQPTAAPTQPEAEAEAAPEDSAANASIADSGGDAGANDDTEPSTAVMVSEDGSFPYDPPGPHVTDDMSGRSMYKEYCEECHGRQGVGTEDAPELEALNANRIAETVRDGPEDMDVFTHEDIPDRTLNILIDYVLLFHPESEPRTVTVITAPTLE